jgi:hypothetical protein
MDGSGSGPEETLTEYICDWPDCPNIAEHVIGVVREIRAMAVLCTEHARGLSSKRSQG